MGLPTAMSGCGTVGFVSWSPTPVPAVPFTPISGYCEHTLAIGNGRLFKYWVGFNVISLVRPQHITFQSQYDLIDDEIRWLRRAGHLRVMCHELVVDTSRLMPISAWFQITLINLVFAAAILQMAGTEHALACKRDLVRMCLALIRFCVGGLLLKMFVAPWRTLKQTGVADAQTPV